MEKDQFELLSKKLEYTRKSSGFLATYNLLNEYNKNFHIELLTLIKLLAFVLPNNKRERNVPYSQGNDLILGIFNQYNQSERLIYLDKIGKLLYYNSKELGISYLEEQIEFFMKNPGNSNLLFKPKILLVEYLVRGKAAHKGLEILNSMERTLQRDGEKFDCYWNSKIFYDTKILCLKEFDMKSYKLELIKAYIMLFILDVAQSCYHFSSHFDFFKLKKDFQKKDGFIEFQGEFNETLKSLGLYDSKKFLMSQISHIAFVEVPHMIGIPEDFLNEKFVNDLIKGRFSMEKREKVFDIVFKTQDLINNSKFINFGDIMYLVSNVIGGFNKN